MSHRAHSEKKLRQVRRYRADSNNTFNTVAKYLM